MKDITNAAFIHALQKETGAAEALCFQVSQVLIQNGFHDHTLRGKMISALKEQLFLSQKEAVMFYDAVEKIWHQ